MRTTNSRAKLIRGFLLIASARMFLAHTAGAAAGPANTGPTKENALAAEKELAQAMRTNDARGFCRLLDPECSVRSLGTLPSRPSGAAYPGSRSSKQPHHQSRNAIAAAFACILSGLTPGTLLSCSTLLMSPSCSR